MHKSVIEARAAEAINRLQARVAELQRCAVQGQEMAKEQMDRCIAAERENDSLRAKLDRATEAIEPLCNFAWSAVQADCAESRAYLNKLVNDLRATLAELSADAPAQQTPTIEEALREAERALHRADGFIKNGRELGFIRMPDRPDAAYETPDIITKALCSIRKAMQK